MIVSSFDNKSEAIIQNIKREDAVKCDALIITFSYNIEEYVVHNYECKKLVDLKFATGVLPLYIINYKGKTFAFYKTYMGGPAAIGALEDALEFIDVKDIVVFGGAGTLNKEICHGRVMVPTSAYRDEGTSYHYQEATDYIDVSNHKVVSKFMEDNGIPYIEGKTWTTDAFYRETKNNFQNRKNEGCISVEMECASFQAACNFKDLNLYYFLTSGDLLDAPKWESRRKENDLTGSQHDGGHFDIAIELATSL